MEQDEQKKRRFHWLLWTGFIVLVVVIGLGPLVMLISFMGTDNSSEITIWERLQGSGNKQLAENHPDVSDHKDYLVQYLFRYCEHGEVFEPGDIPGDYPEPPGVLAEIAIALYERDISLESLLGELKEPRDWHLAKLGEDHEKPFFLLTYLDDFCPHCADRFYLSIFDDMIAVFQGTAPHGKLLEITPYRAKEIDRAELKDGVPFETEEEKNNLLLMYTS